VSSPNILCTDGGARFTPHLHIVKHTFHMLLFISPHDLQGSKNLGALNELEIIFNLPVNLFSDDLTAAKQLAIRLSSLRVINTTKHFSEFESRQCIPGQASIRIYYCYPI
jgi:hypothetical protein